MIRSLLLGTLCGFVVVCTAADDQPKKLTPEQTKALQIEGSKQYQTGNAYFQQGKLPEARAALERALEIARQLYPKSDYPDGNRNLAVTSGNLAGVLAAQRDFAAAESLARDCLRMFRVLHGDSDHGDVAQAMSNLGKLLRDLDKLGEAEVLLRDTLQMRQRLFPRDRFPDGNGPLAMSTHDLADLLRGRARPQEAEPLFREALAMLQKLYSGDHDVVASCLSNLGSTLADQDKRREAEGFYRDALAMYQRLHPGDHRTHVYVLNNLASTLGSHSKAEPLLREALAMCERLTKDKGDDPDLARCHDNVGSVLVYQGQWKQAEPHHRKALEMNRRLYPISLFPDGNHHLARSLGSLGMVLDAQGRHEEAEQLLREQQDLYRRMIDSYARHMAEGDLLAMLAVMPRYRDLYLTNAVLQRANPTTVYTEVWASRGLVSRVFAERQLAARAVTADPVALKLLQERATVRRRRADLLLAAMPTDDTARKQRDAELVKLTNTLARVDRDLRPLLPSAERTEKLGKATPTDLQKVLPDDVAVIEFLQPTLFQYKAGAVPIGQNRHYFAFVITNKKVAWLDLGAADPIETAVTNWREAITSGKEIPAAVAGKVRELVWEQARKELPAAVKTVYIVPDLVLCRVPWGALPGDKPGTILLEDFAIATIPHATFLLDQLWPQEPRRNLPETALVVGGVNYDAEPSSGGALALNRALPVKPGEKVNWSALPGAAAEASGVVTSATKKQFSVTSLRQEKATPAAVLAALPKARYAHFATHGFFADSSFRSAFQLDEKDFERARFGDRLGRATLSPLVMTGLVFAGANNPRTPGRGVVTGESLIDLDLSGLDLAVLSACETGLGDVAGGEGTFGLQRAFHMAGTRDVIASVWKVPDAPTAALMAEFYRNLWEKNESPLAALRQAQLFIYRNPGKIPELAAGFRPGFKVVAGGDGEIKPTADGKAHPLLWAAFTLSGPGR